MDKALLDIDQALDFAASGTMVLTPTLRLERRFLHAYGLAMVSAGKKVWQAPNFMALGSWIEQSWHFLQDSGYEPAAGSVLASRSQILAQWCKVIEADSATQSVMSTPTLAGAAADAWETLQRWGVDDVQGLSPDTVEIEQFQRWHSLFSRLMAANSWVTKEEATLIVIQALEDGALPVSGSFALFAFDDIPPLTAKLFSALEQASEGISHCDYKTSDARVVRTAIRQRSDQFLAAAQWAKQLLAENCDSRIGIVCPELTKQRADIAEAFARVFEPQSFLPSEARYTLPFNFSAGIPLSSVPLIRDAVSFLSLGVEETHCSAISQLMRSPYIEGHMQEFAARSRFDEQVRARGAHKLSLNSILKMHGVPSMLQNSLGRFLLHASNHSLSQKPSQWAVYFSRGLELIGWPGDRQLDSEEYQALMHWHGVLDQLSQLDLAHPSCSFGLAVSLLRQILGAEVFQPETSDSPIQILGALEASGLHFDAVWVMDMNDDIWPAVPQPSPFIPLHLQKSEGMPHSSADRELDFSRRIVERLLQSADSIVMSFAELDEDRELRCSSLVSTIDEVEFTDLVQGNFTSYAGRLYGSVTPVPIQDGHLAVTNPEEVRGGTGILKAQTECPFQAFAKYRLNANEDATHQLGLSPIERGEVMHLTLEHVWKTIGSQESLLRLGRDGRTLLIDEAINHAFFWLRGRRHDIGDKFLKLERQRITSIVLNWLDIEEERAPFKIVSLEKLTKTHIGRLPVRIKVDRIDEVEGGTFYIDYKTGRGSLAGWSVDALNEPQVPIYAITGTDDSVGAAIGQVRADESRYRGVSDREGLAPGLTSTAKARANLRESWEETKIAWKEELERVSEDFLSGNAAVSPKSKGTCQNCHLATLCRRAT